MSRNGTHPKSIYWLGAIWLVSLVLSFSLPNAWTLTWFIILSAATPFLLIYLLIFYLGFFEAAERTGWLKIIWGAAGFGYLVYAHKWSGDVLNELFKVDPSFFPTTATVLTLASGPVSLYSSNAWGWSYALALVFFSLVASVVLPAVLIVPQLWERMTRQHLAWSAVVFLVVAVLMPLNSYLGHRFPILVEHFALWADFNDKYRCSTENLTNASKVLFLHDGYVLAYFPNNSAEDRFQTRACHYADNP